MVWVVGLILITFSACSSRTKHKESNEKTIAVKEHTNTDTSSNTSSNTSVSNTTTKTVEDYAKTNDLNIEYNPILDTNGNYIPFIYSKDINGQKTNVSITGPGRVIDTNKEVTNNKKEEDKSEYLEQVNKLEEQISNLQYQLDSQEKSKSTTLDVKPDYFKYLIWIVIGLLFLTAVVAGVVIYVKITIGKYKKLLNL